MGGGLKLRAADKDDFAVLASVMQDAVVALSEMIYEPEEGRFVLVANRFCWENCEATKQACDHYERIHCGLSFEGVAGVRLKDLDPRDRSRFHSLLTIEVEDGAVNLLFAGGGVVRLEVERLLCHLQDMGQPWPTMWRPDHPVTAQS